MQQCESLHRPQQYNQLRSLCKQTGNTGWVYVDKLAKETFL